MKKLEQEPKTYDLKFTQLTKGINKEVQDWILRKINGGVSILELGCGTGTLSAKMALKHNKVTAIDKNVQMISYAMKYYPNKEGISLNYQIGSFRYLSVPDQSQDIIVSKFMLSELGPFEQQLFLRNAWKALKPQGRLIIAAEFIPSSFWKLPFKIKRWWYKKKLKRLKIEQTNTLTHFYDYLKAIGFEIIDETDWSKGSIRAIELVNRKFNGTMRPGYYQPKPIKYRGITSYLKIIRGVITGELLFGFPDL
jgi:ubiquinone/menaquinone biosynthesis C-methylase UbiE